MRTNIGGGKTILPNAFAAVLALLMLTGQTWGQSTLTHGHQVILEKGLQLEAVAFPNTSWNNFDASLFRTAGFNTINFAWKTQTYDQYVASGIIPGGSSALNFSRWVYSPDTNVSSATYLPNLVSIQYGDEQDLVSSAYSGWATTISALKAKYPNAMVYMNQDEDAYGIVSTSTLNSFVQTVKPDMLSFTSYPFRWQDAPYHDYEGGSPTFFYRQVEQYRKAGLAGLTGDGSQPIPVGMYVQTFAQVTSTETNHRQPTESEFRLQQFAGWAAGMKLIDTYWYADYDAALDSMFFNSPAGLTPYKTTQFDQYAELNRQSANLGPALVRLISTDFRMKMGSHGATAVANTLPTGVTAFDTTADPYLKTITATNLGTCNNGLPGDVLYGTFKPLDPSLVATGDENDRYFMIVNGLTDGAGNAAACAQQIHLTFDFGSSGINSLLRLSRNTGLVEYVALSHVGGSVYSLDLTLDGGTGDLFKYNTGSAFIGTASVPEPSCVVLLVTALIGSLAYAWRRHR